MRRAPSPAAILITGASSGIGAALARLYAAPGVTLFLSGRDHDRLATTADLCRQQGADARPTVVDVTDADAMAAWITTADDARPLDLVIANAGISAGTGSGEETPEATRHIFAVNVNGVVNTVLPALPRLRARRRGQIAIVSSVAGYRGLPGAPAYAASKAAVKAWGEGLRPLLLAEGVGVSVICPGFIETPMTAVNDFRMPFLMDADRAAVLIRDGLRRGQPRITFPWPMAVIGWLLAALPPAWIDPLLARLPRKPAGDASAP